MKLNKLSLLSLSFALLTAGCAHSPDSSQVTKHAGDTQCASGNASVDTSFVAGNIASCSFGNDDKVSIIISPEDNPPINCSAWYAFRVTPKKAANLTINLNYSECGHRYWPKVSEDGKNWEYLSPKNVTVEESNGRKSARLKLKLGTKPLFVSGQEIIAPITYKSWISGLEKKQGVRSYELGKSAEERSIPAFSFGNKSAREQIVLVGRQHPPEITGALVLFPFVETVAGEDELARKFRNRFEIIVVPMLNPDGVVKGHWRHNTGSTDLNRDWGPFKQPETQLMDKLLKDIQSNPNRNMRFFLDFHSTQKDVFYTIPDRLPSNPAHYIKIWLDRYAARMDGYKVNIQPSKNLDQANSKNYVYKTYGVPAVTFEIGDETDRQLIKKIGKESAIAMMETLLETERK